MAQLEVATQKHAYILNELQTSLHTERPLPQQQQQQVHRLAGKVERLDMQLAELCTQVQADDQARELLSRLSGALKASPPFHLPAFSPEPSPVRGPSCICRCANRQTYRNMATPQSLKSTYRKCIAECLYHDGLHTLLKQQQQSISGHRS